MQEDEAYRVLGSAVVRSWGKLPRAIQEALFEEAVSAGGGRQASNGDGLREHLAVFLHDKHPRTDHHHASS
jgi:hypothetical protein